MVNEINRRSRLFTTIPAVLITASLLAGCAAFGNAVQNIEWQEADSQYLCDSAQDSGNCENDRGGDGTGAAEGGGGEENGGRGG